MQKLVRAAGDLAGLTIPELAARAGLPMPPSLSRSKGFIGRAVEGALGLAPSSRAGPDLPGLELKTLPVRITRDVGSARVASAESTYVCTVARDGLEQRWEDSAPRKKLARVLFVPIEADGAPEVRRIGTAFVWSPSAQDDARLACDWDLLTGELLAHGHAHISARLGEVLQVRPKAENAASRGLLRDETGALSRALPRGFYLRRTFTTELLGRTGLR